MDLRTEASRSGSQSIFAKIDPIVYLCTIQAHPVLIPSSDRMTLARLFAQLGYTVGAEIGVGSGPYSEALCQTIKGLHLYAVDAWTPYPQYRDFTNPEHLASDHDQARIRLGPYHVTFLHMMSEKAALEVPDRSLDFVYIDANHDSPYIDQDIELWAPKVRPGGIVSGHDYVGIHADVIRAVDGYVMRNEITPLYLVGEVGENDVPDLMCSWFWVQP